MVRPKPPCVRCASAADVKCLGGGTHGKYRYECAACDDCKWQQIPPHLLLHHPAADPGIAKQRRKLNVYCCAVCRKPKKDHVCTGFAADDVGKVMEKMFSELPSGAAL